MANDGFTWVEAAVQQLLDERIAELELDRDDMAWAKPYADEIRVAVERGKFVTFEDHPFPASRLV